MILAYNELGFRNRDIALLLDIRPGYVGTTLYKHNKKGI